MKKLLLSLTFLSSLAIANNNADFMLIDPINNGMTNIVGDFLPDADYAGTFSTSTGNVVAGSGHSTENLMIINLNQLPDLCRYTGKLTVDVKLNGSQCSSTAAMLHLNEGKCMFMRDIPVEFTSCEWDGSHLRGEYKVVLMAIMKGSFSFTKQ